VKIFYLTVGLFGLIMAAMAAVLPFFPAAPFILIALYGLSRGSKRIHNFVVKLPVVRTLHETLEKDGELTTKQKLFLSIFVLPVAITPWLITEELIYKFIGATISFFSILIIFLYKHPKSVK